MLTPIRHGDEIVAGGCRCRDPMNLKALWPHNKHVRKEYQQFPGYPWDVPPPAAVHLAMQRLGMLPTFRDNLRALPRDILRAVVRWVARQPVYWAVSNWWRRTVYG